MKLRLCANIDLKLINIGENMYSISLRELGEDNQVNGILLERRDEINFACIPLIGQWLSLVVDEIEIVYEIIQISYPLLRNGESLEIYVKCLGRKEEAEGTLIHEDEPFSPNQE